MRKSATARETARAITGPVILMAAGALFLLDYSGAYSVGQTWPVLLILVGLGKALEHFVSN